jgi:hypothetical protein
VLGKPGANSPNSKGFTKAVSDPRFPILSSLLGNANETHELNINIDNIDLAARNEIPRYFNLKKYEGHVP